MSDDTRDAATALKRERAEYELTPREPKRDADGLLPCPFCGSKAMFTVGGASKTGYWHYVLCTNTDCNAATAMRSFAADAAQNWNCRFKAGEKRDPII